ncbi:MAG: DUF5689 domain-containing protein [Tenuifilaceae bacterium]|jgi:hypothetical protein|nr:DUF5689 domain-containing protein [Tenuifilaceae bacterium]
MIKVSKWAKGLMMVSALAFGLFACVDDDFDTPPIPNVNDLPVGEVLTLSQLRSLSTPGNTYRFTEDKSVYAVVTMDDKAGNIYKSAYVQDKTGGINLFLKASGGLYQGDSIRIALKGLRLNWYQNLLQLDTVDVDRNIIKHKTLVEATPKVVTILELKSNDFQGQLVKLENVQFAVADTAETYADAANLVTENRMLEDASGNQVIVRTSGYAKFADGKVPNGSGSIIAIASQYRNDIQLFIRSTSEVVMDGERLGGGGGTGTGTGTKVDPYDVAAVLGGATGIVWVKGYLVGVLEGQDLASASFTAPFTSQSNVMLAASPNETNMANCIPVQLVYGTAPRTAVNLNQNGSLYKQEIMLRGNLEAYFGVKGMKGTDGYWYNGTGVDPDIVGDVVEMAIAELRALYNGSAFVIPTGKKIVGTVVSDKDAGNIHGNNVQIIDAAGTGIMVRFTAAHSFVLNDKIEIVVSNNSLETYNGVLQVNGASLTNAKKIGTGSVEPVTATLNDIKTNFEQYESKLVRIVNATITNSAGTYGGNNGNSAVNDGSAQFVLYTRSQANFAATAVPTSAKTVVGIVSEYSTSTNPNNYQILLRNINDVQ